ncbi:MAG: hypothetical protein KatS3mg082_0589 [Nitrospiraceae bacterium]|nr:MAG: hypothetical protein KatS3mg082_0589 [Nitrospiraceae bacterium]
MLVAGTVQGVGFRPFAYRLARRLGLSGWVANTTEGLLVEAEGTKETVEVFAERLVAEAPDSSRIERVARRMVPVTGERGFRIRTSLMGGLRYPTVPSDLAICADCSRELSDPRDRRFRYPFLTCTRCGPRFSILTDLPYDRFPDHPASVSVVSGMPGRVSGPRRPADSTPRRLPVRPADRGWRSGMPAGASWPRMKARWLRPVR